MKEFFNHIEYEITTCFVTCIATSVTKTSDISRRKIRLLRHADYGNS
ncbi:hypothetical protein GMJAKD_14195 [Candidatus Electrothrix aarhusensis]